MSEVAVAAPPRSDHARDVIGWSAVGIGAVGSAAVVGQRIFDVGPDACSARLLLDNQGVVMHTTISGIHWN